MRARAKCVEVFPRECNGSATGSAFYNFSRYLIKNIEHDWGPSGGFPTGAGRQTGGGCGATKAFEFQQPQGAAASSRYWRWTITASHDGVGRMDAPTGA